MAHDIRILNRFSKDIDYVDLQIPMNVRLLVNTGMSVIGTVVVMITAMPLFIVVILPVSLVYYFVQKFYVNTARQVKRMESVTRSPIYTHFSESITGATTIRFKLKEKLKVHIVLELFIVLALFMFLVTSKI